MPDRTVHVEMKPSWEIREIVDVELFVASLYGLPSGFRDESADKSFVALNDGLPHRQFANIVGPHVIEQYRSKGFLQGAGKGDLICPRQDEKAPAVRVLLA
ncbi:MAG: hypothetical protein GY791_08425 [Alphaproteobacteria bacterium]|nr:hypothetical protein [Alphaproteobacteria bacterium]